MNYTLPALMALYVVGLIISLLIMDSSTKAMIAALCWPLVCLIALSDWLDQDCD